VKGEQRRVPQANGVGGRDGGSRERLLLELVDEPVGRLTLSFPLLRSLPPPFCAAVLKPSFNLSISHFQRLGERSALRTGQIFLPMKSFLQLANLNPAERGSGLFLLWWRSVLVGMAHSSAQRDTLSPAFHPREGVRQQRRPVEVALSGNF